MIIYTDSCDSITSESLQGFFVGWPKPPTPHKHLQILKQSAEIELAIDDDIGRVVGFANAISDGLMSAYIPLLEVLPEYQRRGIGGKLITRLLEKFRGLYMIDLTCDKGLQPFYERRGMGESIGMMIRNFDAPVLKVR